MIASLTGGERYAFGGRKSIPERSGFKKQSRQPYLSELILCQEVQMIFRGEKSILTESACVEVFFECE